MSVYEFKMVPAPLRPVQKKLKSPADDGFCVTLTDMVNDMAADGWEYVRCEALPGPGRGWKFWRPREERQVFVFRRLRDDSNLLPSPEAYSNGPLIPAVDPASEVREPMVSRAVSRRPPSVKATTPRPQSVVVPPPVPGRSASRRPHSVDVPEAVAAAPQQQRATEAPRPQPRPPMAPDGVTLDVSRRVSDPAAVQMVKAGARRVSVRPQTDPRYFAAE